MYGADGIFAMEKSTFMKWVNYNLYLDWNTWTAPVLINIRSGVPSVPDLVLQHVHRGIHRNLRIQITADKQPNKTVQTGNLGEQNVIKHRVAKRRLNNFAEIIDQIVQIGE